MVRNFTIHNDRLTSTKYPKGVTGNVNTYVCQFDIACDIDNLVWFCVFEQGELVIVREIVDNKCLIPQEVLIVPEPIYIGCFATNGKVDDIKRVSTNMLFFDMKQGSYREGTQPTVPTPDVWETLINKNIPIIGNNGNWFIWDIEEHKYVDSGKPSQGSGEGGSVDLSDYFTKGETTRMIDVAISNVYGAIESEVKIINKEKENVSNKANIISNNGSNSEKYPTTKAVYEYGQGIVQASETYTEAYVAQEIGNIETSLENIIEKYGLGGDAS